VLEDTKQVQYKSDTLSFAEIHTKDKEIDCDLILQQVLILNRDKAISNG
jgi:hypothetical protein